MPFRLEFLWTDGLVWLLVAVVAVFAWYVRRQPHLRAPWRRVAQSASGMAALTVLVFFVAVGLLDSIHYRSAVAQHDGKAAYGVEVKSALDMVVGVLKTRSEKTYSAPLATHLFAKETITQSGGGEIRDYPRLRFGGAHLADPDRAWARDVALRTGVGLAGAIAVWLLLCVLLAALVARRAAGFPTAWRSIWRGESEVPWRAILATLLAIALVAG